MFKSSVLPDEIDRLETATFKGDIHVIDKPGEELEHAVRYLRGQKVIGFDTESRPCFSPSEHGNGEALLQLSGEKEAFLFRLKLAGLDSRICEIMADPDIVKVGAAVNDDVRGLLKYRKFKAAGFIDLQKVVWEYGIKDKSVKKMAAIILGVKISKTQQLSNWEADRLSDSQLLYAATDAWVCREMYFKLLSSEKNPLSGEDLIPGTSQKHIEEADEAGVPPKRKKDRTGKPDGAGTRRKPFKGRHRGGRRHHRDSSSVSVTDAAQTAAMHSSGPAANHGSAQKKKSRGKRRCPAGNKQTTDNNIETCPR